MQDQKTETGYYFHCISIKPLYINAFDNKSFFKN